MKKTIYIMSVIIIAVLAVYYLKPLAFAKGVLSKKISKKMIIKAKLKKALNLGKAEFYNKSLGTNGLSCAKCHVDRIGTSIYKGGKAIKIRSLKGAAASFPLFVQKTHKIITLGEKINFCVKGSLKGKPLHGQKLNYLTLYVTSLSNGYKLKGYNALPSPVFKQADNHPENIRQALTLGKHYYDTPFGASNLSCDSCHPGGGAGILGGKPTKPVIGHAVDYPTYKKWGRIITMQNQFNHCISTGEDGFSKKIGSKVWKYLDLYVYSLSKGYKISVAK
jgi:sulfur oxidation c-type cytochrome SoxA